MSVLKLLNEVYEPSNNIMLLDSTPKQNLLLSQFQTPKLTDIPQFYSVHSGIYTYRLQSTFSIYIFSSSRTKITQCVT